MGRRSHSASSLLVFDRAAGLPWNCRIRRLSRRWHRSRADVIRVSCNESTTGRDVAAQMSEVRRTCDVHLENLVGGCSPTTCGIASCRKVLYSHLTSPSNETEKRQSFDAQRVRSANECRPCCRGRGCNLLAARRRRRRATRDCRRSRTTVRSMVAAIVMCGCGRLNFDDVSLSLAILGPLGRYDARRLRRSGVATRRGGLLRPTQVFQGTRNVVNSGDGVVCHCVDSPGSRVRTTLASP